MLPGEVFVRHTYSAKAYDLQICEEAPIQMESEVPSEPAGTSQRPSNVLVPRLLALFGSPYEDAKCLSVSIMNLLAGGSPSALAEHMDRWAFSQIFQ